MFLRRFTDFILQSRLQAAMVAFIMAFIPIIGSISIVIAALVTLRKGVLEGTVVVIAATLPYLLSFAAYKSATDIAVFAIIVLIISNILTWLFAAILRKYHNWSVTLEIAALLGVVAVIVVHLINPEIQDWWKTQLTTYLAKTANVVSGTTESSAAQLELVSMMKRFATGFIIASMLFNALVQLLVARWWQAAMFNPGGLRKELHAIRLSYVSGVIFVAISALAYLNNDIAVDALPVIFLTYFAAGLSLLHYCVASMNVAWILLMFIYSAVIWLFPASIVIVSLIALIDTMANVRQRFKRSI